MLKVSIHTLVVYFRYINNFSPLPRVGKHPFPVACHVPMNVTVTRFTVGLVTHFGIGYLWLISLKTHGFTSLQEYVALRCDYVLPCFFIEILVLLFVF